MTKEFRESLKRLESAADANVPLADQMAELVKLREAVRQAEEVAAARKRWKKASPHPGRLFMQTQWR
jgi:hypothetical protein